MNIRTFQIIIIGLLAIIISQQYILSNVLQKNGKSEIGRYHFSQLSTMRRDQFMLDTETGRIWMRVCASPGKGMGECNLDRLEPVTYVSDSLISGETVTPLAPKN